jgi:hypothetical protein
MRHTWRIALACFALLSAVGFCTTACAQDAGSATTTQTGGVVAGAQQGAGATAGVVQPDGGDAQIDDANARPVVPPPSPRTGRFGRVTTTHRQVVAGSPAGGAARFGGASMTPNGQLRPYGAQAARNGIASADPRVPQGSSWREAPRPASPPSVTTRSTSHSYFPTIRGTAGRNANVAATRSGRGATGGVAGAMMMNGMMGGSGGQGRAGRNSAAAPSNRGQTGAASGRR